MQMARRKSSGWGILQMLNRVSVVSNESVAAQIYEMILDCGEDLPKILPGQFLNLYPQNPLLTLPRPISICDVDGSRIKILYQIVGKGTEEFSKYLPGTTVQVMLPLGNGYRVISDECTHVLIGGGIGTPPLLYLAKALKGTVKVFLGFKDAPLLVEEFKAITPHVFVATESGNYGIQGNVLDLLKAEDDNGQYYYSCGPVPMLKAVSEYLAAAGKQGQISLEARMACGFGVCVGCAVKIKAQAPDGWEYQKVCKDGPVFESEEVLWD